MTSSSAAIVLATTWKSLETHMYITTASCLSKLQQWQLRDLAVSLCQRRTAYTLGESTTHRYANVSTEVVAEMTKTKQTYFGMIHMKNNVTQSL